MPPISCIQRAQDAAIAREQAAGRLPKLLLTDAEAEEVTGLCAKALAMHGVRPVYIGRANRWRMDDLRHWCESLTNERAAGANGGEGGVL